MLKLYRWIIKISKKVLTSDNQVCWMVRLASACLQIARPQQAFETSRKGAPRSTDNILRANGATELRNTWKCSGSCPIASRVLETAWSIICGIVGSSLLPSTGISLCISGTRCWSFAAAHRQLATSWEPMSITKSSDWIKWSIRIGMNFRSFGAAFLSTAVAQTMFAIPCAFMFCMTSVACCVKLPITGNKHVDWVFGSLAIAHMLLQTCCASMCRISSGNTSAINGIWSKSSGERLPSLAAATKIVDTLLAWSLSATSTRV